MISGSFLSAFLFLTLQTGFPSPLSSHDPRHLQKLPFLLRSLPQRVGRVPSKLRHLVGAEQELLLACRRTLLDSSSSLLLRLPLFLFFCFKIHSLELIKPRDDLSDLGLPVGDLDGWMVVERRERERVLRLSFLSFFLSSSSSTAAAADEFVFSSTSFFPLNKPTYLLFRHLQLRHLGQFSHVRGLELAGFRRRRRGRRRKRSDRDVSLLRSSKIQRKLLRRRPARVERSHCSRRRLRAT